MASSLFDHPFDASLPPPTCELSPPDGATLQARIDLHRMRVDHQRQIYDLVKTLMLPSAAKDEALERESSRLLALLRHTDPVLRRYLPNATLYNNPN